MSKKANPATIGAFVLIALVIAAAALAILGSGKLFDQRHRFVLYFDGSLSGLDVGAPVECRGVRVGTVTRILLQYDIDSGGVAAPVYIDLETDRLDFKGKAARGKGVDFHVKRGMRAQLQSQSLVTGKLKIMLLEDAGSAAHLVGGDPSTPEIPTIPTLTESIAESVEDLPLAEIVRNVDRSMAAIAQFTASGEITNTFARLDGVLTQVDMLVSNVNLRLPPVLESTQRNADQLLRVQQELNTVLKEIGQLAAAQSPERHQVIGTLRSVEEAAVALRDLLGYLQLHPEALITGKKE